MNLFNLLKKNGIEEENKHETRSNLISSDAFQKLYNAIAEEFSLKRTFFLTGASRSGTTSCIKILGSASNAHTFSEPTPNLALSLRQYNLGKIVDPKPIIWQARSDRLLQALRNGQIYGEKDLKVYCWLPFYYELFNPRFIFVLRDGRDVVRSLMDWHYRIHGNIYREVQDEHLLSEQAKIRLANLPLGKDITEQGRPRPLPTDQVYYQWHNMSRFEMLTWYWSHVTTVAQRDLYQIGDENYTTIDYSQPINATHFAHLFQFLQLEGFNEEKISQLLTNKINSFNEKSQAQQSRFLPWQQWSEETIKSFDYYGSSAMVQLGYYPIEKLQKVEDSRDIYCEQIIPCFDCLQTKVMLEIKNKYLQKETIKGILQVGKIEINWEENQVTKWEGGAIASLPQGKFDLVLALGIIDQCGNMDQLLIELAKRTKKQLIITASKSHSKQLLEHIYQWDSEGKPRHQWSVAKSRSLLARPLGFAQVLAEKLLTQDLLCPEIDVLYAKYTV